MVKFFIMSSIKKEGTAASKLIGTKKNCPQRRGHWRAELKLGKWGVGMWEEGRSCIEKRSNT